MRHGRQKKTFICISRPELILLPETIEPRQPARLSLFDQLSWLASSDGIGFSTSEVHVSLSLYREPVYHRQNAHSPFTIPPRPWDVCPTMSYLSSALLPEDLGSELTFDNREQIAVVVAED